jgi:hypothetical protein
MMPRSLIIILGLLILPAYVAAGLLEEGFQADYSLSKNDFDIGVAEYRLYPQPTGMLIYESTAKPEGLASLFIHDRIIERSHIIHIPGGLQPQKYEYQQKGGKDTRHYTLDFNWSQQKLVNTNINETLDLPADTQDMLSFQLQLMHTLQAGKKSMAFHLADDDKVQAYRLEYQKEMQLNTAIGELKVVMLEHRRSEHNDTFRFWCAPSLEYLPVRIERIEDDGDRVLFELRRFASLPRNTAAQ